MCNQNFLDDLKSKMKMTEEWVNQLKDRATYPIWRTEKKESLKNTKAFSICGAVSKYLTEMKQRKEQDKIINNLWKDKEKDKLLTSWWKKKRSELLV